MFLCEIPWELTADGKGFLYHNSIKIYTVRCKYNILPIPPSQALSCICTHLFSSAHAFQCNKYLAELHVAFKLNQYDIQTHSGDG